MALGPGSIAFTGFNADGDDNLAFVALETIPAGTVIYFNDNEWTGSGFTGGEDAESIFSWIATADVAPGTVVRIDTINSEAPTSNLGTITYVDASNTGFSNGGDTVYAYIGAADAPTAFLTAVASDGFDADGGTLEGTGLVAGETALEFTGGIDIAAYTGPRTTAETLADYAALLNDPANFTVQDGSGNQSADGTVPDAPFSTDPFSIGGVENQVIAISAVASSVVEGDSGETIVTFIVSRTGGTTGELTFSGDVLAGDTDAGDYSFAFPAAFSGTIAAGEASATIEIAIAGDTQVEADEQFTLALTSWTNSAELPVAISATAGSASVTIANDDAPAPTLGAGSIAFTGLNADGDDALAFVALEAITAGQTIYFSDREWQGTAFNTGEGEVAWTANADIAAGTVVTIEDFGGTPTSELGTVVGSSGFGGSDEIVYAFVGTPGNPSAFLAAIANGGFATDGGTLEGTGLIVGETAIDLSAAGGTPDIGAYTGARGGQDSYDDYAALVNDIANWTVQDGDGNQSGDGTAPDLPFDPAQFTLGDAPAPTIYDALPSLAGSVETPVGSEDVVLVRIGEFTGSGDEPEARAESVSFDSASGRIFVTNAVQSRVDVAQLNADGSTSAAASIDLSGLPSYGNVNSVAVANGIVAVAYEATVSTDNGYVALFDAATGALQNVIEVGPLPDQVTFGPNGQILVANEGEPANGVDPMGSVSIIDASGGAATAKVIGTVGFDGLSVDALAAAGAVFSIADGLEAIEPEYITVSPDGTRAFVTLQEVNAVAVLDLTDPSRPTPIAIQALGGVDRTLAGNAFDGNDRDGVANLVNADIIGLLQPDAIASFEVGGATYFVTANEGDAGIDEIEARLSSVTLDPEAYANAAELQNSNTGLGRLNVLPNYGDTDGDGDIDQIYAFGGRGISIFRQEADGSITKVRETGGEFEAIIARDFPALFNIDSGGDAIDNRSDNKGPEPEGVTVGQVGDQLFAFVTLERAGGVMIYNITDPANASFVTYKPATAEDSAPETLEFIAGSENVTGEDLLITANEGSGTTTLYRIVKQTGGDDLIEGGEDADSFNGKDGDDTILGLGGDDVLLGGDGNDTVRGGTGADWIEGGAGNDVLWGNGGDSAASRFVADNGGDIFFFDNQEATGRDRIEDFGMDDLIVTTQAIRDNDGNGIVTFGGDRILDLFGSSRVDVRSDIGGRVTAIEFDGTYVENDVTYYVYSRVGSDVGVPGEGSL